jgi:hypothetical protein
MNENWPVAAAVAAIAFSCAIYYTAAAWFAHRERMAKIQHGIDPDGRGKTG